MKYPLLIAGSIFASSVLGALPTSKGCYTTLKSASSGLSCTDCLTECSATTALCAAPCAMSWEANGCAQCLSGRGQTDCEKCVPECKANNATCVDCAAATTKSQMCLGMFGEPGFCTKAGTASFIDNGAKYCTGSTPDCDIVAGALSGCTAADVPANRTVQPQVSLVRPGASAATSKPATSKPAELNQHVPGYTYTGCLSDGGAFRLLTNKNSSSIDMTTEICAQLCTGYRYMGVEFATQCFCGYDVAYGAQTALLKNCNTPCAGNSSQLCGGTGYMILYTRQ